MSNTCSGPDGLPPWVFRRFADILSPAITHLFNWSLQDGYVPACFKLANISPIPKCDKPSSVTDFRPISLLPALSKTLERIVSRLFILPSIENKLQKSQFAFIPRPGSGTTSALTLAQHRILKFLDPASGCVRLLSIDLAKAFDKLPHRVILDACLNFRLPSGIIKWISSFVSGRFQRVFVNGSYSPWTSISSGVPQGSVLGPLLFALTVDSLSPSCSNTSIIKYADDILLMHFIRSPAEDQLQVEWDNLVAWSNSLCLPINRSKCIVMDINTNTNLRTSPILASDNSYLKQVTSFKFLGVVFSEDLKWNEHFDYILRKASKRIFILRNLRRSGCSAALMLQSYFAFIRSLLIYSYPCFCNAPDYLLRKLRKLERRVSRIIGVSFSDDSSVLNAAVLSCNKLFSAVLSASSHPLRDLFDDRLSRSTRLSTSCPLRPPFAKTKRFANSFINFANC